MPALVVIGSRDPDFPDAVTEAQWLAEQLRARILIVDKAGQYPHAEMPERIVPELLRFIARVFG